MLNVLETALAYHQAGLGILPVRPDGTKAPALGRGHPYLRRRPDPEDLYRWFARGRNGIGIVCGQVSGNLETLDFETLAIYQAWRERVESQIPGLAGRLCWVRTPGHLGVPGMHARYRCPGVTIPGSMALACGSVTEGGGRAALLIETRGEGSYAIAPGSPASCHETGRVWEHVEGPDLPHLPELTPRERDILLACARALDNRPSPQPWIPRELPPIGARGSRPGDDYNRHGPDWPAILGPHGWELVRSSDPVRYWRRPGKAGRGWSATTGYCRSREGVDLLYIFSANAHPFAARAAYSRFRAFTLLWHHGDHASAARDLARQGFRGARNSNEVRLPGFHQRRSEVPEVQVLAWHQGICSRPEPPSLVGYVPTACWQAQSASPRQMRCIHALGLQPLRALTKGEASHLIGQAHHLLAAHAAPIALVQPHSLQPALPRQGEQARPWVPAPVTRARGSEARAGPPSLGRLGLGGDTALGIGSGPGASCRASGGHMPPTGGVRCTDA